MLLNIGNERKIAEIPIGQIRRCKTQARKNFDSQKLKELAESIRQNGILQPITVRKTGVSEYELISGERRLRASAMCGRVRIPCLILSCSDRQAGLYSLMENLQRSEFHFFEEAEGIYKLITRYHLSYQEAAEQLGKSQTEIENKLRLLHLSASDRAIIVKYGLSENHARALLRVGDDTERRIILSEMIERNMSAWQAEKYIQAVLNSKGLPKSKTQKNRYIIKNIRIFENTIHKAVDYMQDAGILAECNYTENEDCIEYTIKIPKSQISPKSEKELTA